MRFKSAVAFVFLIVSVSSHVEAAEIDFTRDVRPILSGRCFTCHGPDSEAREAGLRLDVRDEATSELESGEHAIVVGKPEASGLIERVTAEEDYLRMPPPEQGAGLTDKEVQILKQWIAQGANYEKHWSFVPPQKPELPEIEDQDWPRNGIDFFVQKRLSQEKLSPSPAADRRTLIRRVSLDLTGLPPTLEEIGQFLDDESPTAYENLVDRLLESPAFGERWGRIWLDLARYADSAGYADDPPRVIWMYRDWVIDAINDGMPMDQFAIEQIAGDLLPDPTDDQLIATAFHRNTMTNSEGGTDDEEFRNAAVVDRVNTTMQVWMGLTMACAQCHTHKYDPITQEEYYNVFAIFNQTEDADRRDEAPFHKSWTPELLVRKQVLESRLEKAKQKLKQLQEGDSPANSKNDVTPNLARYVRVDIPGRKEFLSLAEVQVFSNGKQVAIGKKASQSSTAYNGPATLAVDGNTNGHFSEARSTTHTENEQSPWWEVDLGKEFQIEKITVWNRNDNPGIGDRLNGFRVVLFDAERNPVWAKPEIAAGSNDTSVAVPATGDQVTEEEQKVMDRLRQKTSPEMRELAKKVEEIEKQIDKLQPVKTPIMRELPRGKQRDTYIQIRGSFLDLGPQVQAGVLREFHSIDVKSPNRLDFAKWLFDSENPLTARVLANRHWEILIGRGLVETSEDFGMQGELPTHPELLDWLAVKLMECGWRQKDFIKLIVTSATYRQQSDVNEELVQRDPNNRLLARGPRFRLSAEMIRDQALALSGLLSHKMHGPSVNPPRPKLGLKAAFGGSTDWETSKGEDKYRRGIYTTWRRSIPYPSMDAFDAPSREVCTVRRIRTNTPLQALVTLNDPVYVEAAQALAGRILREADPTMERRVQYGFELCTGRSPTSTETSVLIETVESARKRFIGKKTDAKSLKVLPSLEEEQVSIEEQAAWTVFANVLLNLDETLTRR